jgi:hypothetical protein
MTNPPSTARASAIGTLEPAPRGHLLRLLLDVSGADGKAGDRAHAGGAARAALAALPTASDGDRSFGELAAKAGKVTAVEGCIVLAARPDDAAVEELRATLRTHGFELSLKETRACTHDGCMTSVMSTWNQPAMIPFGWHSSSLCGKHQYKQCSGCDSTYRMTSSNASGHAPSLHCQVCGTILVEWGGTKVWDCELVEKPRSS